MLFVADPDERSRQGYAMLCNRFADLVLVPVFNDEVPQIEQVRGNFPATHLGGPPIGIPALTAVVRSVVDRPQFSFAAYAVKSTDPTAELYRWIGRLFLSFRELEERIAIDTPKLSFRQSAYRRPSVNAPRTRSACAPARRACGACRRRRAPAGR